MLVHNLKVQATLNFTINPHLASTFKTVTLKWRGLESFGQNLYIFYFSGPISFGFASLEGSGEVLDLTESIPSSPASVSSSPPSPTIGTELAAIQTMERAHQTDQPIQQSQVRHCFPFINPPKHFIIIHN